MGMNLLIEWLQRAGEAIAKYVPVKDPDYWKLQQTIDIAIANIRTKKAGILAKEQLHTGVVYWIEQENVIQPWPICLHHIRNAHLLTEQQWEDYYGDVWKLSEYGKTWRCWSSQPEEKQRKENKWDVI